jgi:hypothetical protein
VKTRPLLRGALLTVVLATAACGGQGDGPVAAQGGSGSTAAGATSGATASGGSASGGSASGGSTSVGSAGGPKAKPPGSSGLRTAKSSTPVTAPNTEQLRKNVTDRQKKYIAQNAPPGVDAEAILQSGEDACRRMEIAQASTGQASLAVALMTGQVSNGRDAITYLCPGLKPALAAADKGFPDGSFVVARDAKKGRQVAAGRYSAPQTSDGCTWSLTGPDGRVAADGRGGGRATVTLKRGQRFTSSGCGAWLPAS